MTTFNEFYSLYPRKVGRRAAEKAWDKCLKLGDTADQIISGLQRNLAYLESRPMEFRPHPATWLNQGRFDDEPQIIERPERKRTIADAARDRIGIGYDDFGVRRFQH